MRDETRPSDSEMCIRDSFNFADNKIDAKKLTMTYFAEVLARFVDKPVVDMTGLTGTYRCV